MLNQYQLLIAANTPLLKLAELTEKQRRELKIDFVLSDSTELLNQSLEGTERIARIVADLKSFSHVDETGQADADLNEELEKTVSVVSPNTEGMAVFTFDLQPLPLYACHPGLISQAFLAVIQNAIQSREIGLLIRISSQVEDGQIIIRIADNGCGMSPVTMSRAFDPFFTTREVGSGTGMGLTVAREIFSDAGGTIELDSTEGAGTTVLLRLPLRNAQ